MIRFATAVLALLTVCSAPLVAPAASRAPRPAESAGSGATAYSAPVTGPLHVVRPFDPPATRYGAGHLGVDLRVPADDQIRAAGTGVVQFAGAVAGRGVVVIEHADGVRTEYEPVRPLVRVGAAVVRGEPIGVLAGMHRGCAGVCLHWGARRGGAYFDPLSLLRRLGLVRLLPWPGRAS
jgi:murein DD-endopeptidase MepM/ murein hydrolase activator NlpD